MTQNNQHPHSTREYVEWMAKVWKANAERNDKIRNQRIAIEKAVTMAEINAGCYE